MVEFATYGVQPACLRVERFTRLRALEPPVLCTPEELMELVE